MKRLIALAATLAALTTACAETGAQPLGPAPGGSQSPSSTGSPTTSPSTSPDPTRSMTYELWFNYDGSLFVTHRTEPFTPGVGRRAIEALLNGPTAAERAAKVGTSINPGTRLLDLTIDDGVAMVDLDDTFSAEETPAMAVGSLSQIVYTLTQFDSVQGVVFEVEGEPLTNFGGYELDGAQRRTNFADQLPFILVESPGIGERVSSPVTIAGTSDVFEAVVSIEISDQNGDTIASTFTMATCGTGCRGSYTTDVRYDVGTRQPGTIRVYEVSAMDGSPIHIVEIPVVLTP
ncbi:MAG: GerMN domain-containing protein [Actinobacteria bacterium]|nr:GerMN domain-containing protein [Actinomycetota bacterium]